MDPLQVKICVLLHYMLRRRFLESHQMKARAMVNGRQRLPSVVVVIFSYWFQI